MSVIDSRSGLLLIDKPEGPTSHDVVRWVRRALGMKRVGHTGTLDPMATGLLAVATGAATRLIRFLPSSPKTYTGSLRLGETRDSDDRTGSLVERFDAPLPSPELVLSAAESFLGQSEQAPPAVSARKVDGERLYKKARRGEKAEAPPRSIQVDQFDLSATEDPAEYRFVAVVSAGTYIRSLARDLGAQLGCGGCLSSLRRTQIGPMTLAHAVSGAEIHDSDRKAWDGPIISLDSLPLEASTLQLDDPEHARRFSSGAISRPALPEVSEPRIRVLDASGALLGVGRSDRGILHPIVVIPAGCPR